MVVLPGLSLARAMPEEEWEALGPDERGRSEETHPQFHLKVLLDRIGIARGEVQLWPSLGRSAAPAVRTRSDRACDDRCGFQQQMECVGPQDRRLTGIRAAELPDPAAEAQAIALAMREALETPGRTVRSSLRTVCWRSAFRRFWPLGREADDSAGRPLSQLPPGTLLLAIASAAAEDLAPVQLLALLKHPLVGGEGEERRRWMDDVRLLDLRFVGRDRLADCRDRHASRGIGQGGAPSGPGAHPAKIGWLEESGRRLARCRELAEALVAAVTAARWRPCMVGRRGQSRGRLASRVQGLGSSGLPVTAGDAVPILRQLLQEVRVRSPYGGHPRVFIWGLLEARLQQADLMILGGLNEGVWPALPAPDPWLAPKIRANLGLPGLEFRVGLSAHDFASALGAPQVLITRARRDSRSPTVASRLWLRLQAMTGGLAHDTRLERFALALDDPGASETRRSSGAEA